MIMSGRKTLVDVYLRRFVEGSMIEPVLTRQHGKNLTYFADELDRLGDISSIVMHPIGNRKEISEVIEKSLDRAASQLHLDAVHDIVSHYSVKPSFYLALGKSYDELRVVPINDATDAVDYAKQINAVDIRNQLEGRSRMCWARMNRRPYAKIGRFGKTKIVPWITD